MSLHPIIHRRSPNCRVCHPLALSRVNGRVVANMLTTTTPPIVLAGAGVRHPLALSRVNRRVVANALTTGAPAIILADGGSMTATLWAINPAMAA